MTPSQVNDPIRTSWIYFFFRKQEEEEEEKKFGLFVFIGYCRGTQSVRC